MILKQFVHKFLIQLIDEYLGDIVFGFHLPMIEFYLKKDRILQWL